MTHFGAADKNNMAQELDQAPSWLCRLTDRPDLYMFFFYLKADWLIYWFW
jgi:hypothetical protein